MMIGNHSTGTLDALAALVASARTDAGHSRWDVQGVRAALIQAANRPEPMTLAQLTAAALTCATDADARTPVRIAHDGPWWTRPNDSRDLNPSSLVRPMSPDDCDICSRQPEVCAFDDSHEYRRRNAPVEKLFAEKKSDTVHPDGGDAA